MKKMPSKCGMIGVPVMPNLPYIIILIDFIGWCLWMWQKPSPWACISFLGSIVIGGLVI